MNALLALLSTPVRLVAPPRGRHRIKPPADETPIEWGDLLPYRPEETR